MSTLQPSIWNGPAAYGPFGRPALRHPWGLRLLAVATLATLGAITFYWWLLTAPDAVCEGGFKVLLPQGYFRFLPKGYGRFKTSADIFGAVLSVMICVTVGVWRVRAFVYTNLCLRGVHISPTQFPEGYRMAVEAAEWTGLRKVPDAYVLLGNGRINAYASGHGHRRFVAVHSDFFEIGGAACDPEALQFVINHEVGHLAAGHVGYFRLLAMSVGSLIPFSDTALSRAQEHTADSYGYEGAPADASGMIGVPSTGKHLDAQVNFNDMANRAATERGFWLHLVAWFTTYPILTWHAHAPRDCSRPGRLMVKPPLRNALCRSLLPAEFDRHDGWPPPAWAAERLRAVKPLTDKE